jgi:hypothetical protein
MICINLSWLKAEERLTSSPLVFISPLIKASGDEATKLMDKLLPILEHVVSACFDHGSLQSRLTPSSLVTSTCPVSTLFIPN